MGSISTQSLINNSTVTVDTLEMASVFVRIRVGGWAGTLVGNGSLDGEDWIVLSGTNIATLSGSILSSITDSTSIDSQSYYGYNVSGLKYFRLLYSGTGTVNVAIGTSNAASVVNKVLTPSSLNYVNRQDTFTAAGNGTTVDVSTKPLKSFAITGAQTGTVTSWTLILEGSLDGTNFTTMVTHTNVIGNNVIVFSGANLYPVMYIRVRCSAIVLGVGTSVTSTILGME